MNPQKVCYCCLRTEAVAPGVAHIMQHQYNIYQTLENTNTRVCNENYCGFYVILLQQPKLNTHQCKTINPP